MNWNYLFKHWFSTIVFTPILIEILEYLESKNYTSKLLLITITVLGILVHFIYSLIIENQKLVYSIL